MPGVGASSLVDLRIARKRHATDGASATDVVRDLVVSIGVGEILCLVGPSGCGKTTALRILLGLDRDFEGTVEPDPARLRIGVVFQEPRLLPWRTVEENVRLVLAPPERASDLDALFADVGLDGWRTRRPGELSLGLARRVALARALAVRPQLLVLDEAFVSLDDGAADDLRAVVLARAARDRTAVLLVTHDVREALRLADRIVLLTPCPAHVLGEVSVDRTRDDRSPAWVEARRDAIVARFKGAAP